eukprot:724166-Rhodomonas_salina.1
MKPSRQIPPIHEYWPMLPNSLASVDDKSFLGGTHCWGAARTRLKAGFGKGPKGGDEPSAQQASKSSQQQTAGCCKADTLLQTGELSPPEGSQGTLNTLVQSRCSESFSHDEAESGLLTFVGANERFRATHTSLEKISSVHDWIEKSQQFPSDLTAETLSLFTVVAGVATSEGGVFR